MKIHHVNQTVSNSNNKNYRNNYKNNFKRNNNKFGNKSNFDKSTIQYFR